jgi:hypothetical protein
MPLVFISTVFIRELVSFYQNLGNGQELSIDYYLGTVENTIKIYVPEFQLNLQNNLDKVLNGLF